MFADAVVVGIFHKDDNRLSINPKEDMVFGRGDQVVALANSGTPLLQHSTPSMLSSSPFYPCMRPHTLCSCAASIWQAIEG